MTARVAARYDAEGTPLTAEQYPHVLRELFGPAIGTRVAVAYPADAHPSPGAALAAALGDHGGGVGSCTQLPVLEAAGDGAPVFGYEFTESSGRTVGTIPLGAAHGADVRYFFDSTMPGRPRPVRPPEQAALAEKLVGWWTTFARTGQPGPDWPDATTGGLIDISTRGVGTADLAARHRCDVWRSLRPGDY